MRCDYYGRLAEVFAGGKFLQEEQVKAGFALAYRQYLSKLVKLFINSCIFLTLRDTLKIVGSSTNLYEQRDTSYVTAKAS